MITTETHEDKQLTTTILKYQLFLSLKTISNKKCRGVDNSHLTGWGL